MAATLALDPESSRMGGVSPRKSSPLSSRPEIPESLCDLKSDSPSLCDLPGPIVAHILSRSLCDPRDVVAVRSACRGLRDAVASAPLRLSLLQMDRVSASQKDGVNGGVPQSANASSAATSAEPLASFPLHSSTWCSQAVRGIAHVAPLLHTLSLATSAVSDADVAVCVSLLTRMQVLVLDNCRKLTDALAPHLASSPSLTTISLHRCFGLTPRTVSLLLEASRKPGSVLTTLAFSHVDRLSVRHVAPPDTATPSAAQSEPPQEEEGGLMSFLGLTQKREEEGEWWEEGGGWGMGGGKWEQGGASRALLPALPLPCACANTLPLFFPSSSPRSLLTLLPAPLTLSPIPSLQPPSQRRFLKRSNAPLLSARSPCTPAKPSPPGRCSSFGAAVLASLSLWRRLQISHPALPLSLRSLSSCAPSLPALPLSLHSLSPCAPSLPALPLSLHSLSPCAPSLPALPLSLRSLSSCAPSLPALPLFLLSLSLHSCHAVAG
ncbi:unnamed protein product [Closterium sp. NIES-53]